MSGRLAARLAAPGALILATSLSGCSAGSAGSSTPGSTTSITASSGTATASATLANSPRCATGSLQLIGSTAFMPIAQAAAKVYMSDCPGAHIQVEDGDSAYGLTKVRDAVASHSKSAGSMIAMYDGTSTEDAGLIGHPVGVLIYSMVAHTGLFPSLNISTAQLRKIFVSPYEQGTVAVGRLGGSGSGQAFDTTILGGKIPPSTRNCPEPNGKPASFTNCTADSTGDLLSFVNGTPNAIGYALIAGTSKSYPDVSVLSIDNAGPTRDNVANGSYKFSIIEHLYAAAQSTTALAQDFLAFLPHYNAPDLPPDYVPCVVAVNTLGTAC